MLPATQAFFHTNPVRVDGLHSYCRSCASKYHKELKARRASGDVSRKQIPRIDFSSLPRPEGVAEKQCNHCRRFLPASSDFFYSWKDSPVGDGLQLQCKECLLEYQSSKRKRIRSGEYAAKSRLLHPEGKKICSTCLQVFPATIEFFDTNMVGFAGLASNCKACKHQQAKTRLSSSWSSRLVTYAKARKKHGSTDLTPEFLEELFKKQNGKCAWFGVHMSLDMGFKGGTKDPYLVSMDRLDCNSGYTRDNVVLACQMANLARGDTSMEDFEVFIKDLRAAMRRM